MTDINPQDIADDLIEHLDNWYSMPETYDNELDTQIHKWYVDAPNIYPKRPYFSPSAATACPRELFYKAKRAPKDSFRKQPHQGRWTSIGTAIGGIIQRDILAMERNLEDKTGAASRFRFERTAKGFPMFEEFAKKNHPVTHGNKSFYLFGLPDGIMEYTTESGEVIRVGLEVKSKQSTPARTSLYSMKQAEGKHVKQCVCYAEMYNVDYYVILYVNAAHKGWTISDEDYRKNPDIRAFGLQITDGDKTQVFDRFVKVLDSVERNEPLPLDIDNFTFNSYKEIIAKELPQKDFDELQGYARRVAHSDLPAFQKANVAKAAAQLDELREVTE